MLVSAILVAVALAPAQNVPNTPATSTAAVISTTSPSDDQQGRATPPDRQLPRQRETETTTETIGDRRHSIGLGGQMAVSNRGFGTGSRMFLNDRFGVNLNVGWFKNGPRYQTGVSSGSTFAALPSFIWMLTASNGSGEFDIRPYVGGGLNYVSTSRPVASVSGTTTARYSGLGGQAFGGVEMTFAKADFMTLSAEGVYYKLPVNFVNAQLIDGFNAVFAIHFYLK